MQKKKGISLIVLVITIIVMIILAAAIIISLNNNGVIDRARSATDNYLGKQIGEQVEIAKLQFNLKKHEAAYVNKTEADYIEECLESALGKTVTVNKLGKNYKIEVEGNNKEYLCKYDGEVISRDKVEKMATTSVYAKLEDGVLYLRATQINDDYKTYTSSSSIASNWENETPASVTKVVIEEPIAPNGLYYFFQHFSNLEKIDNIGMLHTENATSFYGMFKGCGKITEIDVSKFDTSKSNQVGEMFNGCESLTSINVTGFDTSKVSGFYALFKDCKALTDIDVSSFDTGNATEMASMFKGCISLKKLDLSSFNTSNITSMENMFNNCSSLTKLDLRNFNTSKVSAMNSMFGGCSSLISLDLTNFNTKEVTSMQSMFAFCSSLKSLNLSSFNTNKVTTTFGMYYTFSNCPSLKELNLGKNFIIHDEAVYNNQNIITGNPADIKVTTTEAIAAQVKKYSNLTDSNFIYID